MSVNSAANPARRQRLRRLRHPGSWHLSTRLVAVMMGLLTIICVLVGIVSYATVSMSVNNQLDSAVQQAAVRTTAFYTNPGSTSTGPDPLNARATSAGQLSAVLSDGVVHYAGILSSEGTRQQLTTADAEVMAELSTDGTLIDKTLSIGDYRLIAQAVSNGDTLITGLPIAATKQTLSTLVLSIGLVSLAALLALGLAGTVIIRRSMRPLAQLSETATKVAVSRLDAGEVALSTRVPESAAHPGTEVGNVGNAFNAMLDNVSHALQARQRSETKLRRFVADASHELRTPLTAIRGYAELLAMTEPLSSEGQTALGRVQDQSLRMTRLVENLLTLARLDEQQNLGIGALSTGQHPTLTPVNVSPLVMEAMRDIQVSAPDHQWILDIPDHPVEALSSESTMRQVLLNLLSNAAKHTPAGTVVTAKVSRTFGGSALLQIIDNGPGIEPAFLDIIFDRFSRADQARTGTTGSTGLGLSIVQGMLHAQHGSVEVTSQPGQTVFTVRLPGVAEPGSRADTATPETASNLPPNSTPDPTPDPASGLAPEPTPNHGPAQSPAQPPAQSPAQPPAQMRGGAIPR